jgi:hypothetical protein
MDCDTYWIQRLPVDAGNSAYAAFLNALVAWNKAFWGCSDAGVDNFGLVYGTPPLSAGDAKRLIDLYIRAVDETLSASEDALPLSPGEKTEMREALERLSALVVTDPSLEPSKPTSRPSCQGGGGGGGMGGEGGYAGQDPGSAGHDPGSAGHGGAP